MCSTFYIHKKRAARTHATQRNLQRTSSRRIKKTELNLQARFLTPFSSISSKRPGSTWKWGPPPTPLANASVVG